MFLLKLFMTTSLLATASTSILAMQWQKRVLLVGAPDANDRSLHDQRRILARCAAGAEARDLAVVEVVGNTVAGASDPAAALRQRYRLPPSRFAVVLIGKDGGAKLRDTRPIPAATLEATIDAMPMRRGGGR